MKSQKDHTHPADHFEVAAMKVEADIKASVRSQHTNPSSIISEKMIQYPVQVRAACGDKDFLIYDNGSETERLLTFGSDIGLSILADSESWFMDLTYDTAPSQSSQLYVIRAAISETCGISLRFPTIKTTECL